MSKSHHRTYELAEKLHSVVAYLYRNSKREDLAKGLTAERLSLLSILIDRGPQTINSLAKIEQVSAPAITRTIKSLEKQAYVIKSRSKTDQRVVYVAPTRKSQQLLEDTRRKALETIEDLLAGTSEEELQQLQQAIELLQEKIVDKAL